MFYEGWAAALRRAHPSVLASVRADAILSEYETLLPRVCTHGELLDVMSEMFGELGASHFSVDGAPGAESDGDDGQQGVLGATFAWNDAAAAWEIVQMLEGAAWDEQAAPPLSRPSVGAQIGDLLVAINQVRLSKERPPESALRGLAGKEIYITLASARRHAHGSEDADEEMEDAAGRRHGGQGKRAAKSRGTKGPASRRGKAGKSSDEPVERAVRVRPARRRRRPVLGDESRERFDALGPEARRGLVHDGDERRGRLIRPHRRPQAPNQALHAARDAATGALP